MFFAMSLILSIGPVFFANLFRGKAKGIVLTISAIAMAACLWGLFLPALALTWLFMVAGAIYTSARGRGPESFRRWSYVSLCLAHSIVAIAFLGTIKERVDLRREYPVESLEARLQYERSNSYASVAQGDADSPAVEVLSDSSRRNLEQLENHAHNEEFFRTGPLKRLHAGVVSDFAETPGFGIGRFPSLPTRDWIVLPEPPPIKLPSPEYDPPDSQYSGVPVAVSSKPQQPSASEGAKVRALPREGDWRHLHAQSVFDFINAKGFGYVMDHNHVRGFQAHQFHEMPKLFSSTWKIQSIDLVSLLKHKEPVAYVSENLPRMQELRHAPTLQLRVFESAALTALGHGDDLKIESTSNRIYMLGAIRAGKRCLDCHAGSRGKLLGAFSYVLRREEAKDTGF